MGTKEGGKGEKKQRMEKEEEKVGSWVQINWNQGVEKCRFFFFISCVQVFYLHTIFMQYPQRQERISDLELQMAVSHCVGDRNQTQALC